MHVLHRFGLASALLGPTLSPSQALPQSLAEQLIRSPSYRVSYSDTTLANGLRVLVAERRFTPLIAADLFVQIGQRDDPPERLGLAHLVEHVTDRPDLIAYRRSGGWQFPAYTSYPTTVFSATGPAVTLEGALFDISEVLRELRTDGRNDIARHRQAVLGEGAGAWRQAHFLAARCQWDLYYLGVERCRSRADVSRPMDEATPDELQRFWRGGYLPNNSILVIAGAVDAREAIAQVDRLFGDLKPAPPAPRREPAPAKEIPSRRVVVEDSLASSTRLLLTYRTAAIGTPEYPALLVLQEMLGGGEGSLLHRRLVGEGRPLTHLELEGIGVSGYGVRAPLFIRADVQPSLTAEAAEQAIADALRRVARGEFEHGDLARAKNRLVRGFVAESRGRGVRGLVYHLGFLATAGRPELINDWLGMLDAVTANDVSAAAAKYLSAKPRFTVVSTPVARAPVRPTGSTP